MGEGSSVEREDIAAWLKSAETKLFFKKVREEQISVLDAMTCLTTVGDQLAKDFYEYKGMASALSQIERLAEDFAKGEI